jgi:hypothetical protein
LGSISCRHLEDDIEKSDRESQGEEKKKTGVNRHIMNSDGNLDNNTSMLSGAADTEENSMIFGMPKSPGSLLGSSIRSNQVESFDIESESCSVTEENPGWRLGMPWFNNNVHNKDLRTSKKHEAHRYYGGIMKASGGSSTAPASPSPTSTTSNNSRHFRPFRKNSKRPSFSKNGKSYGKSINRHQKGTKNSSMINSKDNPSVPIARTKSNTADSIADFDESEWTPPDSSYGAACPVCGFIPKRVRQMVEMTLIAAMVFFLIYLVVTTSMKIADAHRRSTANGSAADNYSNGNNYNRTGSSSATSTNVVTDDDVYVEKYSSNNNNGGGNGDDAAVVDDNYNNDYSANEYGVDDDGGSESDYSQNYNYNNNGNNNQYYNGNSNRNYNYYDGDNSQNYNDYNRNRKYYRYNDDYNGGRRQLRSSPKHGEIITPGERYNRLMKY